MDMKPHLLLNALATPPPLFKADDDDCIVPQRQKSFRVFRADDDDFETKHAVDAARPARFRRIILIFEN